MYIVGIQCRTLRTLPTITPLLRINGLALEPFQQGAPRANHGHGGALVLMCNLGQKAAEGTWTIAFLGIQLHKWNLAEAKQDHGCSANSISLVSRTPPSLQASTNIILPHLPPQASDAEPLGLRPCTRAVLSPTRVRPRARCPWMDDDPSSGPGGPRGAVAVKDSKRMASETKNLMALKISSMSISGRRFHPPTNGDIPLGKS